MGEKIYSGSKGSAELIIKSYFNSFIKNQHKNIKIGIGRAGNVIGGGDWAKDRIIVDCMLAWSRNEVPEIRSPHATRPWQHVLEPLSGYLDLGANLHTKSDLNGFAFNFGPNQNDNISVLNLINDLSIYWNFSNGEKVCQVTNKSKFFESSLLKLNCDKALFYLKWKATLNYPETVKLTSQWYYNFYKEKHDLYEFTDKQINSYIEKAKNNKIKWTE